MTTYVSSVTSALGDLTLTKTSAGLSGVYFEAHRRGPVIDATYRRDDAAFDDERCQLDEYFAGTRTMFDLALDPSGTDFQKAVWALLRKLRFGETASYADLAARLGKKGAARAVGSANARNPISIIVPCHRVVGQDGALTGYAGEEWRKKWLLDHEKVTRVASPR